MLKSPSMSDYDCKLATCKRTQGVKDKNNTLDLDRDGYIALSELRRSLVLADIHDELTTKQQRRLCKTYKKLDDNHDGRLDYNEFVRASLVVVYRLEKISLFVGWQEMQLSCSLFLPICFVCVRVELQLRCTLLQKYDL
uniref:EF-hand domain-containing protein n=1 Tax=Romanomermis culicivorax TaxID=13658 RepID=A0A915HS69_ROMCU